MKSVFESIGRAVYAVQLFETILIHIFEFYKMATRTDYFDKTKGYIPEGAFKLPIKAIVKELRKKDEIDPELAKRLENYAEDRHLLIHRWFNENGISTDPKSETNQNLKKLAIKVEKESKSLASDLLRYMVKYSNPDWAVNNQHEYTVRINQIFHDFDRAKD